MFAFFDTVARVIGWVFLCVSGACIAAVMVLIASVIPEIWRKQP